MDKPRLGNKNNSNLQNKNIGKLQKKQKKVIKHDMESKNKTELEKNTHQSNYFFNTEPKELKQQGLPLSSYEDSYNEKARYNLQQKNLNFHHKPSTMISPYSNTTQHYNQPSYIPQHYHQRANNYYNNYFTNNFRSRNYNNLEKQNYNFPKSEIKAFSPQQTVFTYPSKQPLSHFSYTYYNDNKQNYKKDENNGKNRKDDHIKDHYKNLIDNNDNFLQNQINSPDSLKLNHIITPTSTDKFKKEKHPKHEKKKTKKHEYKRKKKKISNRKMISKRFTLALITMCLNPVFGLVALLLACEFSVFIGLSLTSSL